MDTPGRPTLYKPDYCGLVHNYCLLGATNEELAGFFGVAPRTLDNWIATIPEFASALKTGRAVADGKIARRLFERAMGFSGPAVRVFQYKGETKTVKFTQHHPPDTQACIFWLRNRRPQDWRERATPDRDPDPGPDIAAILDAAAAEVRDAAAD